MSGYEMLRETFKPWSGSVTLAVSWADYRWLRHCLGERHVWELRKRGKRSHAHRRKGRR